MRRWKDQGAVLCQLCFFSRFYEKYSLRERKRQMALNRLSPRFEFPTQRKGVEFSTARRHCSPQEGETGQSADDLLVLALQKYEEALEEKKKETIKPQMFCVTKVLSSACWCY